MTTDLRSAIVPKSDQLNADDLIAGPITIKITEVSVKAGEQPVSIHFEGDNGKPFKPCKSMCRVMVQLWGADGKQYAGKSMTLYCDPSIKFGGMQVGGIRISHMSDIGAAMTLALTSTRGKKAAFVVKPLVTDKPAKKAPKSAKETADAMVAGFAVLGVTREMLEGHIGSSIDAMTDAHLADLRAVYKRLGEGIPAAEFFTAPGDAQE